MAKINAIYLFVIAMLVLNVLLCDGRQLGGSKGILKTIKTANGDVIDCVDIYKQPSLAHPLLQNHTIQLEPSFHTTRSISQDGLIKQSWHNYGQCPQGSVPILRTQGTQNLSLVEDNGSNVLDQVAIVEYKSDEEQIYGAHARVNIWKPTVNKGDASLSRISISGGGGATIMVGWRVAPGRGANNPTTFIYWSKNNDKRTGCYNLDCHGFVQTGKTLAIGANLGHISKYGGVQYDVGYDIRLDDNTKNWWVSVNGSPQGYWPSALFSGKFQNGDAIQWGGEVIIHGQNKTPTQMGSGHMADEGSKKACYMTDIKFINENNEQVGLTADDLNPLDGGSMRYSVTIDAEVDPQPIVYFGGPGGQV